jgi:hypothetical protein
MSNNGNVKAQDTSKPQDTYHRLADVSLRTSATVLAILFAYTFAIGANSSMEFKSVIVGIGLVLLFSIVFSIICLFVRSEIGIIRGLAITSTALMVFGIGLMFILLVYALFGH